MRAAIWKGLPIRLLLFYAACCFVSSNVEVQKTLENNRVGVNIGVIYEEGNRIGKMGLNCIKLGLSDFYNSHAHYNTRISLKIRAYTKDSAVGAAAAALYLLKYEEVKAIMGPATPMDSEFVIYLGEEAQVPVLSYSITSTYPTSVRGSYFIRATQDYLPQAKAIHSILQAFGWREIVPVYVDDDYGRSFISNLADILPQVDARIPYRGVVPMFTTNDQISELLYTLKSMSTRVFVVHMSSDLASRLFLRAKELEMMEEGYAWITTTGISNELGSLNRTVIESMQGVIGLTTYVPHTYELREFESRWDQEFRDMKLSVQGLWAYDAACALARAVEAVANPSSGFQKKKVFENNLTDLDTLGVSSDGPKLLKALHSTNFIGLAGEFSLSDWQLETSVYKIINVIGSGSKDIGFWTPEDGLKKNLNSSNSGLKAIIWPGDMTSAPKGWAVVPVHSNKMMRVGVPVKAVYEQLLQVDNSTGILDVKPTGFCIDVFEAVMDALQYSGLYKYFPFPEDGSPTDSYDNLVYQVFLQNFDIVMGDITITANRSSYVDFSLPYTDSGVTMVVPVRNKRQSAWVFLMPLTKDLWMASLSAFIFIAFAVWVLEHRINEEFRGPPSHQAGTSLFYSFSILVFAQRENLYSNLARFVVIIWIFVVFVLTQSYTASLTSMLTVQQLQPSVTDVNELISKGDYVGYQEGSFVKGLLMKKGFHETRLVSYNTSENLEKLLSKGSSNGGIAAVFDEIPYMKLFVANYSSKYIMIQPLYKAEGFGFAFPKGSPLVSEVSSKLLSVIEDDILRMERKWGMPLFNNSDEENKVGSSGSLSLDSFWGLFLIGGVASGISLLVFTATFLYENRHIWLYSNASIRHKAQHLSQVFMQRDMASHTLRKTESQKSIISLKSDHNKSNRSGERELSSFSDETEEDTVFTTGTATPSDCVSPPPDLVVVEGHPSIESSK